MTERTERQDIMTNSLPARAATAEHSTTRVTAVRRPVSSVKLTTIPKSDSSLLQKEEDCCCRATD